MSESAHAALICIAIMLCFLVSCSPGAGAPSILEGVAKRLNQAECELKP